MKTPSKIFLRLLTSALCVCGLLLLSQGCNLTRKQHLQNPPHSRYEFDFSQAPKQVVFLNEEDKIKLVKANAESIVNDFKYLWQTYDPAKADVAYVEVEDPANTRKIDVRVYSGMLSMTVLTYTKDGKKWFLTGAGKIHMSP